MPMFRNQLSMRASFILAVLVIGVVGVVFTFFSGEIYRHAALDTQRATFSDYLRMEVNGLREEFEIQARILAQQAQQDTALAKSLAAASPQTLTRELNNLYQYAGLITGNIPIDGLYLFDGKLTLLTVFSSDIQLNK